MRRASLAKILQTNHFANKKKLDKQTDKTQSDEHGFIENQQDIFKYGLLHIFKKDHQKEQKKKIEDNKSKDLIKVTPDSLTVSRQFVCVVCQTSLRLLLVDATPRRTHQLV